jgi:tetratricopeptide (TPR) repeat protein
VWAIPPILVHPELPDEGLAEAGQRAAGAVLALRTPRLAEWFPVATAPPTFDALVAYLQGFGEARVWDSGQHFERAARLDSTFTWALLEASSMGRMMDRDRANAIVAALTEKRERLNPLQNAVLNAHVARVAGDYNAYYQAMGVAAGLAPERFLGDYARSAWGVHLPRRALRLLDQLDAQNPSADLAPSWSFRAELLHELGEHSQELDLTRRARSLMPRSWGALAAQVRAFAALGEVDGVWALVDTALSLPFGVNSNPGTVMIQAAEELRGHGQPVPAGELTRRAIEWFRNASPTPGPAWVDDRLAYALYLGGEWDEAEALYRKAIEAHPSWRGEYLGWLGAIAAHRGDRAGAEEYLGALARVEMPAEGEAYQVAFSRARIAAQLGDPERALAFLREGYRGGQGVDLHTDVDLQSLIERHPGFKEFARPKG